MKTKIITPKGSKISSFIHKSKDEKSSKLAILMPGFLDSKDYLHLTQLGKDLCDISFTVVRFDPLGVWESEGNTDLYSVSEYLNNVESVIKFMKKLKKFEKIFLIGHSLGGMISMLYAAENIDIDGVVAIMPPSSQTRPKGFQKDLKKWRENKFKISLRQLPKNLSKEKKFKVPVSFLQDARKYDALKTIKKYSQPLLLIAGELDNKITSKEIEEIYNEANQPKKLLVLNNVDHDYRLDVKKVKIVNKHIIEFLLKYSDD